MNRSRNTVELPPKKGAIQRIRLRRTRSLQISHVRLTREVRLQLNVENLFDANYYTNADSNTNISFGFPRAARVGVTTSF